MDIYTQIAVKIIEAQEAIMGPVAVEQAQRVPSLKVDNWARHQVSVSGDGEKVIDELVGTFRRLFGQLSVEVSKESAAPLIDQLPSDRVPKALR